MIPKLVAPLIDDPLARYRRKYAFKDEWVTCSGPEHHKVCRFARSVEYGSPFDRTAMTDWQQPEPEVGGPMDCTECGHPWGRAMSFHIGDRWRS